MSRAGKKNPIKVGRAAGYSAMVRNYPRSRPPRVLETCAANSQLDGGSGGYLSRYLLLRAGRRRQRSPRECHWKHHVTTYHWSSEEYGVPGKPGHNAASLLDEDAHCTSAAIASCVFSLYTSQLSQVNSQRETGLWARTHACSCLLLPASQLLCDELMPRQATC